MMMSPAAFRLHSLGTAVSAVRGRAGFVLDEYLAGLTDADLDSLGDDPVFLAAELCAVGVWEPVAGGYRVLDAFAVQVCADRVRELREEDARRAGGPGPGLADREPVAVGVAGTTRFGDRVRQGPAVSFRCARCRELAGVVRVARAGPPPSTWGGRPAPSSPPADWSWTASSARPARAGGRDPGRGAGAHRAGERRSGRHAGGQLGVVGGDAFLLPGVRAELLRRGLGHLRRLQRGVLRLHPGRLPERASASCRLTGLPADSPGYATSTPIGSVIVVSRWGEDQMSQQRRDQPGPDLKSVHARVEQSAGKANEVTLKAARLLPALRRSAYAP